MADWQSSASLDVLHSRARLLQSIRKFFSERGVLEVETPALSRFTVTDVHLHSFSVPASSFANKLFLQTSPEYAMKRLLASRSGAIYQICKVFRQEETSRQHNPEFTMLEWYRPGFSMDDLIAEVEGLVVSLLDCGPIPRFTYRELFEQHLSFDPHKVEAEGLRRKVQQHIEIDISGLSDTDCLQLLMERCIEPTLPSTCFVYDYPEAQAALARIEPDESNTPVAKRFELYCEGMEVANGYFELTDPGEQLRRFENDRETRSSLDLPDIEADDRLLAAMENGLPECAGVALGIDRLLMAKLGISNIEEVLAFPGYKA